MKELLFATLPYESSGWEELLAWCHIREEKLVSLQSLHFIGFYGSGAGLFIHAARERNKRISFVFVFFQDLFQIFFCVLH